METLQKQLDLFKDNCSCGIALRLGNHEHAGTGALVGTTGYVGTMPVTSSVSTLCGATEDPESIVQESSLGRRRNNRKSASVKVVLTR